MVDVVASKILTLINADNCSIDLWDEHKQKIIGSAYNGFASTAEIQAAINEEHTSVTELVLASGHPLILEYV